MIRNCLFASVLVLGTLSVLNCSSSDSVAPVQVAGSAGTEAGPGTDAKTDALPSDGLPPQDSNSADTALSDTLLEDSAVADSPALDGPPPDGPPNVKTCAVLVVGGGLGGVAAAVESASSGVHTCLFASESWLGGQLTSQGVPPDDAFLEFSPLYEQLREGVRQSYIGKGNIAPGKESNVPSEPGKFNPGSCWVSRLCAEPKAWRAPLDELLAPVLQSKMLELFVGYEATELLLTNNQVTGAKLSPLAGGETLLVESNVAIDATELGDLLPLAGKDTYRVGFESKLETGEPDGPSTAAPECVQPFTFSFALERRPEGEDHSIPQPQDYDPNLYSLLSYEGKFFPGTSFWTYRRLLAAENFSSGVSADLAVINWGGPPGKGGNDFNAACGPLGCNLIDRTAAERSQILARGKQIALGFAYWLQHDAPRDDTGKGYPNLLLRTDVFDTPEGLSREPYIRESRRLKALTWIREQDLAATGEKVYSKAATLYSDSLGLARYVLIDRHPCALPPPGYEAGEPTSVEPGSAQIPLGALIPEKIDGLLAGAKNIGTTHISNGLYRLHPVEWNIGLAAGATAALAVQEGKQPRALRADTALLRKLQHRLLTGRGGPLFWTGDRLAYGTWPASAHVLRGHKVYVAAQMLGVAGIIKGGNDLPFNPDQVVSRAAAAAFTVREFGIPEVTGCASQTFADVPCTHPFYGSIQALADRKVTSGTGGGLFSPDQTITRAQFVSFLVRASCQPVWDEALCPLQKPSTPSFSDVPSSDLFYGTVETAKARGWLEGDPAGALFAPSEAATRGTAATWLWNHLRGTLGL